MLPRVVDHVATLAERGEVAQPIVGRVMIEVRTRNVDPGDAHGHCDVRAGQPDAAPPPVAPMPAIRIPPAAVAQVEDASPVRTTAMLAPAFGPAEAD